MNATPREIAERLRNFLTRFSYKPDWQFEVTGEQFQATLHSKFNAPDVDNPERWSFVQSNNAVSWHDVVNDGSMLAFMKHAVKSLEAHEHDEWFKLDGCHVVEPHPEKIRQLRIPDDADAVLEARESLRRRYSSFDRLYGTQMPKLRIQKPEPV